MKLGLAVVLLGFGLLVTTWLLPGCVLADPAPAGVSELVAAVAQLRADLDAAKHPAATALPGALSGTPADPVVAALAKFTESVTAALAQPSATPVIGGAPTTPWWEVLAQVAAIIIGNAGAGLVVHSKIAAKLAAAQSPAG